MRPGDSGTRSTHRHRTRRRRRRGRVDEFVDYLAKDVTWRVDVRQRLVRKLDDRLLDSLTGCWPLADAALELDLAVGEALTGGTTGRRIAKAVYEQVPTTGTARLRHTARTLRVIGVYLCSMSGRDLSQCPCVLALTSDGRSVEKVLGGVLDEAGL
jgi:hypothetical protein